MSQKSSVSVGTDVRAGDGKAGRSRERAARPRSDPHASGQRDPTPDLHSHCPICGNAYQTGEEMVLLASAVFCAGTDPVVAGGDTGGNAFLGHRACVLPRLLTLLASFQPANRFERASQDFAAGGRRGSAPS